MPVYSQSEEDDPAKHFDEVGKQYTYSVLIIILLKTFVKINDHFSFELFLENILSFQ